MKTISADANASIRTVETHSYLADVASAYSIFGDVGQMSMWYVTGKNYFDNSKKENINDGNLERGYLLTLARKPF